MANFRFVYIQDSRDGSIRPSSGWKVRQTSLQLSAADLLRAGKKTGLPEVVAMIESRVSAHVYRRDNNAEEKCSAEVFRAELGF
jgi:hypothetical protein